ncbi:MAG: proteasome subunit alpha [Nitriliruptorales bacterium]|nr:proteasome subunit alpha [Nitriliruptorales bacterium]
MPFYVPPEQQMREKADFARKGISRGRSVIAVNYVDGAMFVADNPSATLNKLSEIYDRIAFAAVGKYSEFEQLRVGGIRNAEVRGYQYAREDVSGRSLANAYANALGTAFSDSPKPFEVELLVAEVTDADVELYHILYDGSITDEQGYVAIGGSAEAINTRLAEAYREGLTLPAALQVARRSLVGPGEQALEPKNLEVAGLDRTRGRRKFFRLPPARVAELLEEGVIA